MPEHELDPPARAAARRTSRSSRCRSTRARLPPARPIDRLNLPSGSRLISVMRDGHAEIASGVDRAPGRATRCWRSSSRARRTSSAGPAKEVAQMRTHRPRASFRGLAASSRPRPSRSAAQAARSAASCASSASPSGLIGAGRRDRAAERAEQRLRRRAGRSDPRDRERPAPSRPFLDIRSPRLDNGEQGCSRARVPARSYATNHHFYVDYTDRNGDTRIVEYQSRGLARKPRKLRQIFFQNDPYPNHNGGNLVFGPEGYLYAGTGDGGSGGDPQNRAQNLKSTFGKLLQFNVTRKRPQPVDRRLRATESLALLVRPSNRRPVHRRRRAGRLGGDRLHERGSPTIENYGWRVYEGRIAVYAGQTPHAAGQLVFPYRRFHIRRLLRHRRLRLPRQRRAGCPRAVLLRRQLLQQGLSLAARGGRGRASSRSPSTVWPVSAWTRAASSTSPPSRAGTSTSSRVSPFGGAGPAALWPRAAYASAWSESFSARIS